METTPQDGTQVQSGQAQTSTPATTGQPAAEPQAATQVAQATPQIPAEIQAQLDAANSRAAELEKQSRYHQSRADQIANQLKAVVGVEPPKNPLAPYVDKLTKAGYDAKDAETFAGLVHEMVTPLQQQLQTTQGALQAQRQIPAILQEVYKEVPGLWQNPQAVQAMEQALWAEAAAGNVNNLSPMFAANVGFIEAGRSQYMQQHNPNPSPAPQPQQQLNIRPQFSQVSTFQPQQTLQPAPANQLPAHLKAEQAAALAAVVQRHNLPALPQQ